MIIENPEIYFGKKIKVFPQADAKRLEYFTDMTMILTMMRMNFWSSM